MSMLGNITYQIALLLGGFILAGCGAAPRDLGHAPPETAAEVSGFLDKIARTELSYSPETSTQLGLSAEAAGYEYFARLDDRSEAGITRIGLERIDILNTLDRIDADTLPKALATSVRAVRAAYADTVNFRAFGHGQVALGFVRPYAVDQLSGGYVDVPDLLLNRQSIRVPDDTGAYLARLAALAGTIDDERRRLLADEDRGVRPPGFILERMRTLAISLMAEETPIHPVVVALENQLIARSNINEAFRQRVVSQAQDIVSDMIIPSYQKFVDTLVAMEARASDAPGVWQLPSGDIYYDAVLAFYSGRTATAQTVHDEGLAQVANLTERLDRALIANGYTEGTIGERLALLGQEPEQIFSNDDEGRRALIDSLRLRIGTMEDRMGEIIETAPSTGVSIASVPDYLTPTAPGGYYISAPADGTAPGLFFINLRDTLEWPAFTLPTLLYHETLPGHHLESALISEQANLPLIRQMIWMPVFGEGWAVYAEDLAYELGFYDEDPLGELGYLQSLLFRAARLVVDTGLHHERWSRQRAIDYLVNITGQPETAMTTEVDRYTVWPGQATAYMSGRQAIRALREDAQLILGDNFSLKAFHGVILGNGPRPVELVERDVEAWVVERLAANRR